MPKISPDALADNALTHIKRLFYDNRSLMGPDIRKSLNYFSRIHPEFETLSFPTGYKAFDWTVPQEWHLRDAFIKHESGEIIANVLDSNLHVVGYSTPINMNLTKTELIKKLHTLPENPEAIPYVTSYYRRDWGFALAYNKYRKLPEGNYHVYIDSDLLDGQLQLIEAVFPGEIKDEILFTSYLCHPSMANNELSGPSILCEIINYIKHLPNRRYTYRFILGPETLGAVCYLSKNLELLKSKVKCGFILSCVGDDRGYSHVQSRYGNNLADKALSSALLGKNNVNTYSYLERGSDERQYCAPNVDLPVCTFCRSKFGKFDEYHTSMDNLNLVSKKGLYGSISVLIEIITAFENGLIFDSIYLCEPQLGKRDLYPHISKRDHINIDTIMTNVLAYCDGSNSVFEISQLINMPLAQTNKIIEKLKKFNLIYPKGRSL